MKKPENIIESREYVEPHTFQHDREAILFYSYIEAHEYINQLQSELEKAKELLHESKLQIEYLHENFVKTGGTGTGNAVLSQLNTFLEGSGNKTK